MDDLTLEQEREIKQLKRLVAAHQAELVDLQRLNDYYEGRQQLAYMAPELELELEGRLKQVVINWPRLVVDSVEERLDVMGFRLPDQASADKEFRRIWQANNLDELSQQAHVDALVMRRSYVVVGAARKATGVPLITVESPLQMFAEFDPGTKDIVAAYKSWESVDLDDRTIEHATLYLPNVTIHYRRVGAQWVEDIEHVRDEHNLGEVPVEVLVNRPRTGGRAGVSELTDVIPLSDAACKIATDMMISAEFHAMPRRWALGFHPDDFVDKNGKKLSTWSKIAGRIWATTKKRDEVEVGQFPEAQLSNFHSTLDQLAKLVASLSGLAPHTLGFTTDNPASADAIR
ncbi:MAG: phage portal protein, partial [Actinomycetota bacterium]|nr:phage portal protein [Actinomycetota bacterium]